MRKRVVLKDFWMEWNDFETAICFGIGDRLVTFQRDDAKRVYEELKKYLEEQYENFE